MFRLGCYWIDKSSLGINVTGKLQVGFIYSHAQNKKVIFRLDKLFSWGWRGTWTKSKSKSLYTADGNAKSSRCCENQCGGCSVKSNYVCYMSQLYHFSLFSPKTSHQYITEIFAHQCCCTIHSNWVELTYVPGNWRMKENVISSIRMR